MGVVFISHSSADDEAAGAVRKALQRGGHRSVFLDFHPEDGIPAGRSWEEELYAKLRAAQAVVVLCSRRSMASKWCFAEITHAKALGKQLFPVRIEPCEVDPLLTAQQILDARDGCYDGLLRGLAAAGLDPATALALAPGRPPYPGLLAFEEADAAVFFGRNQEVQQCLDLLNRIRRYKRSGAAVLVGPSGSGKSSVLRAGVLPRLRHSDEWIVVDPVLPRQRPYQELAIALATAGAQGGDWRAIRDALHAGAALADLLLDVRLAARRDAATALLAVDQAEELLAAGDDLLGTLAVAIADGGMPTVVLFSLRSDFVAAFQRRTADVGLLFDVQGVDPLPISRLPEIVEGPAGRAGVRVDPDLARAIAADAGPQSLPLVAFALRELFEARLSAAAPLTAREYREGVGGLDGSVARAADAVYDASAISETIATGIRAVFLGMVRLDDQGQQMRVPLRASDIPEPLRGIVERFVAARLLVARSDPEGEPLIEMAHEALLRSWKRLERWVSEDRAFLVWRRRLSVALDAWEHSPEAVLRGAVLVEAAEWLELRGSDLSKREQSFIAESLRTQEAEQRRWQRAYEAAEEQRVLAISRQLAAQSELVRTQRPNLLERSVLLAMEAMRLRPSLEADLALRRGLTLLPLTRLRLDLDAPVRAADLSRDGGTLVVGGEDGAVRAFDAASGEQIWRVDHGAPVYAVAFAPDGRVVVSGSEAVGRGAARISDARTGARAALFDTPAAATVLAVSPDSRYVATATGAYISSPPRPRDPFAYVWQIAGGRLVARLEHASNVLALAFAPDSRQLATVEDEGRRISVFEIGTKAPTRSLLASASQPAVDGVSAGGRAYVGFSPGGSLLGATNGQTGVTVWETHNWRVRSDLRHSAQLESFTFSDDELIVAIAGWDGAVRLWQLDEVRDVAVVRHVGPVRGIRFLDGGQRIVTFGQDGTARVWTFRRGGWTRDVGREIARAVHEGSVMAVATAGNAVASASWDGTVRVSRIADGLHRLRLDHDRDVNDIAFSPDGALVATAGTNDTRLWDARTGEQLAVAARVGVGHRIAFSPDGMHVAAVVGWGQVWRLPEFTPWLREEGTTSTNAVAFSANGALVAFGGADDTVHVWDVGSAREVRTVRLDAEVLALAFGRSGLLVAATGYRYTFHRTDRLPPAVHMIDVATGERRAAIAPPEHVADLAFSPDGSRLLTVGGLDARLWDTTSLREVASARHDSTVGSVAFAPDGGCFATMAGDEAARIWDSATCRELVRIPHPASSTISESGVASGPDGSLLGTANGCSGYVWEWGAAPLLEQARRRVSRDLTKAERHQYLGEDGG